MKSVLSYSLNDQIDRSHIVDGVIFSVDASNSDVTITLPDLTDGSRDGAVIGFYKSDGTSNKVTVQTTGNVIYQDGSDYTKLETTTANIYIEIFIINGLYKLIAGEWDAVA